MKAEEAKNLYEQNWSTEFTTYENLYQRIKSLAENGCYTMCMYVDSKRTYEEVQSHLSKNGYNVENYNGRDSSIMEISWG